jgi:aminoglycoside phosphotransferase (APT) family kinase protein
VVRGIDVEPVSAWLCANVEGLVAPFHFELIAGGRSNLTFTVSDAAGAVVVLRRPPIGTVLATAHDVAREHRLISAVGHTGVPVAPALGLCTDPAVNGADFYVMGYVPGQVLSSRALGESLDPEIRRVASERLIDVLVDLHRVDVDSVGLGTLSRRDGYCERQLRRWATQWERSKTHEVPAISEVERRLRLQVPAQSEVAIVHGDYRFGNVLTAPDGSIAAVLDWELCTLGDPLADVGWLLVYWSDPGEPSRSAADPTGPIGFLTRREMLDRYGAMSGRDLSGIGFFEALGLWRISVISQGVYARYRNGQMGDDAVDLDALETGIVAMAERALDALDTIS